MNNNFPLRTISLCAALAVHGWAGAQQAPATTTAEASLATITVSAKRANRVSSGATGLPMEIKDTPQSISVIDSQTIEDFGVTGSLDALRMGVGIDVQAYETNRATFSSRGFEVQFTQIDGLGLSNSWGTVVGQMDTFLFERIEFIRGANGLLTGMGNASGTINYVRKRPTNVDGGEVAATIGSHNELRGTFDYNKVLTEDGKWAARLVVAKEEKDSYLRDLHNDRTSIYAVVDGQIGDNGVLTAGYTYQRAKQDSPMWGSLTLMSADGRQLEFPRSSSTAADWAYWNTLSQGAFVEYTHSLANDWEAKFTYDYRRLVEDTSLLYAYSGLPTGGLNEDFTGLLGWPYRSATVTHASVVDAKLSGSFRAFERKHDLLVGLSHSRSRQQTDLFAPPAEDMFLPLPAFPYDGDAYPEPNWGPRTPDTNGKSQLTRAYLAANFELTDKFHLIAGFNAVHFEREGSTLYGDTAPAPSPDLDEVSPYLGITYDITPDVMAYASYSDIFQVQEQKDIDGNFLDPVKGVNAEIGVKAEWLDKKLLTTAALFTAEEKGLAQEAGVNFETQTSYYEANDVKSKGIELEATGRISPNLNATVGFTHLRLTGPDGDKTYEWVPRNTFIVRVDGRLPMVQGLRLGAQARWQDETYKVAGPSQDSYWTADAFASYEINKTTTLRLNVNNIFDEKYINGLAYGAIYSAPRTGSLTLQFKL